MMPGGFGQCQMGNGDLSPHRFCIGEAILSMRQLLKRACLHLTTSITTGNGVNVDPFIYCIPNIETTGVMNNNAYTVDYFSAIGSCFALSRGGVRLKVFQAGSTGDITVRGLISYPQLVFGTPSNSGGQLNGESIVPVKISMSGAAEIEYPQYTPSFARVNWYNPGTDADAGGSVLGSLYSTSFRAIYQFADNTKNFTMMRQASDDTDMGCFIGVLPTITNLSAFSPGVNPL
jgi:hypothetical protein